METVMIEVPAALYVRIFEAYEEGTSEAIVDCLADLAGNKAQGTTAKKNAAFAYPRPGKGTITGMVWDIADRLLRETGEVTRDAVIRASAAEGININTANTQYSHWKKANS